MKKCLLILLFFPLFLHAQEATTFTIIEHTASYDIIKATIGPVKYIDVNTPNGTQKKIGLDQGSAILEKGAPDLSKLAFSLIVPNSRDGRIEIISSKYAEVPNVNIAPSKGKIYRHEKPTDFPYIYGATYKQNEFYPSQLVELQTPYILRDFRGQTVHLFPTKYNPVTKTVRTYSEIIFKVSYNQQAVVNILPSPNEFPTSINPEFAEIYKYQFLNYKILGAGYTPLPQVGNFLILCDSKFEPAMHDFVEWKERKGYRVFFELTDTMSGGPTEANLLARVTQYYQLHQIAYLLIVGDASHIPPLQYWTVPGLFGPSDIAYAYQSGNDHYPEFIVGRFSADTLQHALTQVKRTLLYERQPNTLSIWMKKQVALGSDQGPGDKGQYDQQHLREIADSNKNYGPYVFNYEFFDGTHGGNDAPGPPPVTALGDAINNGIGLINYCGHGSLDMFTTSTFIGTSQMPNLTNNNGQWPFIFSTACQNGRFVNATCLGENFLRAVDGQGNPKGAVAAIMSSINQSWDPPMEGQDEMNALLRHARPGTYQTTFGAVTTSGIMSTNDHYNTPLDPNGGNEIADTWIVFGDPTVQLYTEDNGNLSCSHNPTIGLNSTHFEVNCAEEHALIGLYYQGEFLASAVVQGGKATFNFAAVQNVDTIFVTATKQNLTPYYGQVLVTSSGAPFGLEELAMENIQVFPNPTTYYIQVQDIEEKVTHIQVLDYNGKIVLESTEKRLNVSQCANGVYQLRLYTKGKVFNTRFTKN